MRTPAWSIITLKELKDASRDRRAMMALLLFPLLGPLMIYFLLNAILDIGEEARENIEVPVLGLENAADLADYLRQNGVTLDALEPPEGVEVLGFDARVQEAVRERIENRSSDFVLVIPHDFEEALAASRTVNVELHYDSSRTAVSPKVSRIQQLVQGWNRETALLRLVARGQSPEIITPVALQSVDVATPQARAQAILGMVPFFVLMAAFVTGMGVAVDATAGERERKSLEPLLVNPVPRGAIVLGKWMAAALFSCAGLVLVLALNLLALSRVPLERMGLTFDLGPLEIAGILAATLPLAFFASSLQIFIGIFARSFKDAQAYLSLIMMLPMLPFLYNIFNTQGREFWMNFVPLLAQNMLLADVVSGREVAASDFLAAALTAVVFALIFAALAAGVFRRERIIFS